MVKQKTRVYNIHSSVDVTTALISELVKCVCSTEKQHQTEINIVFVDQEYITNLNKAFLNNNDSTDVIAFPLSEADKTPIIGEIYVNLDKILEQAQEYKISFHDELIRVVSHGILHILGYDDRSESLKAKMTQKEDYYVELFKQKGK